MKTMSSSTNLLMSALLVLLCFYSTFKRVCANDLILIRQNGQIVSGDFDFRSDENQLSLTKRAPQITLRTSHSWDEFQSMTYQGNEVTKSQLLNRISQLKKSDERDHSRAAAMRFWFPPESFQRSLELPNSIQSRRQQGDHRSNRVAAFNFEAYVANWDRDAELDGLVVHLYPVNAAGQLVAIDGQVEMRLIGQKLRQLDSRGRTLNRNPKFPELEQWTKRIRKSDFGLNGAVIRLEFKTIRPELHTELASGALLTGTLGIAGQGRFAASAADVSIRPFSPFRDEHFLRSRSRSRVNPLEGYRRGYRLP